MKIGIDISQIVHEGTGVATYVRNIVSALVTRYPEHEYVFFGASFRKLHVFRAFANQFPHVRLVAVPIPPTLLDILWNKVHMFPVEWFTGPLHVFWSSDWTQPPLIRARGVTTIHDLSVYRYPNEMDSTIVATQKRKLFRSIQQCDVFFCDSDATKRDAIDLLKIPQQRLLVVHAGL